MSEKILFNFWICLKRLHTFSNRMDIVIWMEDENSDAIRDNGIVFDNETLYWTGYIYRYWNIYTGESSKDIYKQAPAKTMQTVYLMYHTMSPELAIERLKESYNDKK